MFINERVERERQILKRNLFSEFNIPIKFHINNKYHSKNFEPHAFNTLERVSRFIYLFICISGQNLVTKIIASIARALKFSPLMFFT